MESRTSGDDVGRLWAALAARGDNICLRSPTAILTAAQVLERARRAAKRLERSGAARGRVLALWRVPVFDAVPCLLGAWSGGLVTYLADAREPAAVLERQLHEVGACLLMTGVDVSAEPVASVPALEAKRLFGGSGVGVRASDREAPLLPATAATLLRTSGGSGRPKVAVHGLKQHTSATTGAIAALDLREGDGWFLALPYNHVGGLSIIFRGILAGAEVMLPDPGQAVAEALAKLEPTHLSLVPTQLARLLDTAPASLTRPRSVLLGGDSLSPSLRQRGLESGVNLAVSYGSTESTAFMAVTSDPDIVARPRSNGHVLPDRRLEVSSDGELRIGGPTLFLGYLDEGRVRDPRDDDGLFATGDIGYLDADAVLYVEGRRDRMFISGGENIHPGEIEAALESIAGVEEAIVVAAPHAEFGHRPIAFLVCTSAAPRRAEIEARLRGELPGYKIPDAFYRLPEDFHASGPQGEQLLALLEHSSDLEPL
jgi:O-succinylbenzoic acid--CoA ligase